MGKPPTCARVGIVVINIFFVILGLLLFLGGSFLRSRYSALNQLVSGALDSLEKFLQSAGYGTVDLSSSFGFSDLFHAVAIVLIFLGLFLVILSTIGSCAGCFMSTALLIIILGLLLFLGGSFLRSRYSALNQLVSGALDSLEKFLQSAGYGTVDLSSSFGFSDLFHAVAIVLIFLGLFLVILSTIGSCAGCFMSTALLIIYVVVCVVLILGQIAAVVIFYKYPQVYDDAIKQSLKNGIQSNYQGINGTTPFSIGWNVVMQQLDCCGVENYSDFTGASNWTVNFPAYTLQTPLACCKTLPSSSDYTCAAFGSATTGNNNMYTVLLIMFAIIICMARRDNKVSPRGKSTNQRSVHKTRDKKYQFN